MRLAVQENLLPGADLTAKWRFAREAGFDGIELLGQAGFRLRERLAELRAARAGGAAFAAACVNMDRFIADFDPVKRHDAVENVKVMLSVAAEVGAVGVVTPAAWGMFSAALPPFTPPRPPEGDRAVLLESLAELGEHAGREGVLVLLEPLNRFADHMLNRLAQARELCEAAGHPSLRVIGDLFHMNIEEGAWEAAFASAGMRLAHVHVCDSNRLEPGRGHLDFAAIIAALRASKYDGWLSFEGRLSGPPEESLPRAAAFLRAAGA